MFNASDACWNGPSSCLHSVPAPYWVDLQQSVTYDRTSLQLLRCLISCASVTSRPLLYVSLVRCLRYVHNMVIVSAEIHWIFMKKAIWSAGLMCHDIAVWVQCVLSFIFFFFCCAQEDSLCNTSVQSALFPSFLPGNVSRFARCWNVVMSFESLLLSKFCWLPTVRRGLR